MATLLPEGKQSFQNSAGSPLIGGKLYTYDAGTSTPRPTYQDAAGTVPNTNPVILDARGEATVFWNGSYKVILKDASDVTVWTVDGAATPEPAGSASAVVTRLADTGTSTNGDYMVGVLRSLSNSVATTQHEINERAPVSIFNFFSQAEVTDALAALASGGAPTIDVTAKLQLAIDTTAPLGLELLWEGAVLCGVLTTSAADIRWVGKSGARIVQKGIVYTPGVTQISVTGDRPYIRDIHFDGNQWNMSAGQGTNMLVVTGKSPTLINVITDKCVGVGYTLYSSNGGYVTSNAKRGVHINCNFDDNGGLGMNTIAATYADFFGCTFDRNGYGVRKTRASYADTSHSFAAFGFALRMRSHHMNFVSCSARDNGRDGMNVNQGSYAIKFVECLAYGNDDGGFTIASDSTGSGLPGEGEACWDLEYVDCEAYNNFTSGLCAYQQCNNVTVSGGRYYNNHRVAGYLADASSYFSGIYFAGGSTGINVDVKAYDERQFRVISGVSGAGATRVLTATGWVPGTMLFYPRVAIYSGADQSFLGYGNITAESAGSVTIQSTSFNGVTLASIAADMYVTQAVQHNGVFVDNSCLGNLAVDGYGHHVGVVPGYTGRNISSGFNGSNTSIILPKERQSATELLVNGTFDANILNWGFALPGGGASNYFVGTPRRSAGCVQLVGGTSAAQGDATLIGSALQYCQGEFVEYGGWVYASARADAQLILFTSLGANSHLIDHPGGGWKYLKVGVMCSPADTGLICRIQSGAGKTCYFDSLSLKAIEMHIDERDFNLPSRTLPV